jgi:hypothetical protein
MTVVQRFVLVWRQATPETERTRPSWWVTARDARTDESRLAWWRLANRPPGERSRLANWLLTARPPAGEGDQRWSSSRPSRPSRLREDLRRLRSRTRP